MNIAQIESNLQNLVKSVKKSTFIYDVLLAYGLPKASITRLQKGDLNLSKKEDEIIWKNKLYFQTLVSDRLELFPKEVTHVDVQKAITSLKADSKILKHAPRFIIVTDFKNVVAADTKTGDVLDVKITELAHHYDFFLPWAGMEKAQHQNENPADVKAAERMARLYDEIRKENATETPEEVHSLNVFLSRLLFCFFAEDTGIFPDGLFINSIDSHTQPDGSDLSEYIEKLFEVLNTKTRKNLPHYLEAFPYVNGGLFKEKHKVPKFTRRSRQAVIESGDLNWSAINPDIFGSMMQAVVTPEHRGALGMHYTSVPNIMKVIGPLFLDDLYEEFKKSKSNKPKLEKLLVRLTKIKIFDPACGSGNFLIVAYKELRKLEMKIIKQLNRLALSGISLSQFYGIEIDDFAHEVAILSLWLAEHQMNVEFYKEFGKCEPTLPLKDAGNIMQGNACRLDWEEVCPKDKEDEVYVLGNPPYVGARVQTDDQKRDVEVNFNEELIHKDADYISCWFIKASLYIGMCNAKFAFVSTNSICQGDHVAILWPRLFKNTIEIFFAYESFKWTNNAKSNAGVSCVIVGLRRITSNSKYLFRNELKLQVSNINAYLSNADNIIVSKRLEPLSKRPKIVMGSQARDGGFLLLTDDEKKEIIRLYPKSQILIRKLVGSEEFINDQIRWCLWISNDQKELALSIPPIKQRIDSVYQFRKSSKAKTTNGYSSIPHQFAQRAHQETTAIIIPAVSSEKREYIPFGFIDKDVIVSNRAFVIYDQDPYVFGLISSRLHMRWINAVAGRLETRINYSSTICYNNFPFPNTTINQKQHVSDLSYRVISEREKHSEKTIAQLYDPGRMPEELREAHHQLDLAVERCYRSKPFTSDEERLEYLFNLYEKMIAEEKANIGELSLFDEPLVKNEHAEIGKKRAKLKA